MVTEKVDTGVTVESFDKIFAAYAISSIENNCRDG